MSDAEYDAVVVGAGAAGLNAALVLARARRRVAVVDAGGPREAAGYGAALIDARVEHVEPGFTVRLVGGAALSARRLVVATGLRDELPGIPEVARRWGKDVFHCPYCHGYEVRDQPVGVLGTSPGAVHQALLLRQWSADGRVVTDRTGRTTVPGVWAVGNVADPRAQVVTGPGMGCTAAVAVNADLLDEDVHQAVALHRAAGRGRVGGGIR